MQNFCEFIDRKERESKRHLKIVKKLLESHGMKIKDYLDNDDPYIFVQNPGSKITFDGIRLYKIGSQLAYRIQMEENTHPFGKSYQLPIEDMFEDLLSDHHKPEVAGKKLIEAVAAEVKKFFTKSADAERDLLDTDLDANRIAVRSTMGDYSNMVYSKG